MCWFDSSPGHNTPFFKGFFLCPEMRYKLGFQCFIFLFVSLHLTLLSHFLLLITWCLFKFSSLFINLIVVKCYTFSQVLLRKCRVMRAYCFSMMPYKNLSEKFIYSLLISSAHSALFFLRATCFSPWLNILTFAKPVAKG